MTAITPAATPTTIYPPLRASWGEDTCDPADRGDWSARNPARGQCGVTSLVLQDLLGGELVLGEVLRDGVRHGVHYWNRLPGGAEIDLTREQFQIGEEVVGGHVVPRPPDGPRRCREQYELLRTRVFARLKRDTVTFRH
ncbi:MAG: YunG family protein [Sciscionella sp.]